MRTFVNVIAYKRGDFMASKKYLAGAMQTYVGNRIRSLRRALGLTQGELAKKYGSTINSHSRYENGNVVMGIDKFFAIADALGVTPNDLAPPFFFGKDVVPVEYAELSPENRQTVNEMIFSLRDSQRR